MNIFLRGVRIHFRVENIYGRDFLFFTRFMPTNGFAQPFVGIISFWLHLYGGDGEIRTLETVSRLHDFQSCALDQLGDISSTCRVFKIYNVMIITQYFQFVNNFFENISQILLYRFNAKKFCACRTFYIILYGLIRVSITAAGIFQILLQKF